MLNNDDSSTNLFPTTWFPSSPRMRTSSEPSRRRPARMLPLLKPVTSDRTCHLARPEPILPNLLTLQESQAQRRLPPKRQRQRLLLYLLQRRSLPFPQQSQRNQQSRNPSLWSSRRYHPSKVPRVGPLSQPLWPRTRMVPPPRLHFKILRIPLR